MQAVLEGPYREAQVAPLNPLEFRSREQTVTDKLYGFVIDFIIRGLHQFGEHVNDKKFNFVRVEKAEQDWTDKGDHNQESGAGQEVRAPDSPGAVFIKVSSASVVLTAAISASRAAHAVRTAAR